MFKKIIRVAIFIPIAIVLILLSIANRQSATLAFNPFDPSDQLLSISAPFFVFLFIALMIGMILGSMITWFNQGKHRQRARQAAAESEKWHHEADSQKERAENLASQTTNQAISPVSAK